MENFDQGFGRRLKVARKNAQLTQVELGQLTGLRQDQISQFEKGHIFPSLTTFFGV